jgi:hypothetical protein
MLDGTLEPICAFFTNVSVVTELSEEKRSSGIGAMAVDSRCKLVSEVRLLNDIGSGPAGTALFPMT